ASQGPPRRDPRRRARGRRVVVGVGRRRDVAQDRDRRGGRRPPPSARARARASSHTDVSEREREIKLAAPADFVLPPLTDPGGDVFAEPSETVVLDATYFDTDDLRLARSGASLRHRNDEGWTVKLPTAPASHDDVLERDEHRFAGAPWAPPEA